jgi:hypothetical protein
MKLKLLSIVLALMIVNIPSFANASSIEEIVLKKGQKISAGSNFMRKTDRILCVDGLKVFQTTAIGYGKGAATAVSNIQLYEENNGKVVPVRCKLSEK